MKTPESSKKNPSASSSTNSNAISIFSPSYASVCFEVQARLLNHDNVVRLDKSRRRKPHPDQWGLFDGERAQ